LTPVFAQGYLFKLIYEYIMSPQDYNEAYPYNLLVSFIFLQILSYTIWCKTGLFNSSRPAIRYNERDAVRAEIRSLTIWGIIKYGF
jgi:hypothetical protein